MLMLLVCRQMAVQTNTLFNVVSMTSVPLPQLTQTSNGGLTPCQCCDIIFVFVHVLQPKMLTALRFGSSFEGHFDKKHSLRIEIQSPSETKSRHAYCFYRGFNIPYFWITLLQHESLHVQVSFGSLHSLRIELQRISTKHDDIPAVSMSQILMSLIQEFHTLYYVSGGHYHKLTLSKLSQKCCTYVFIHIENILHI